VLSLLLGWQEFGSESPGFLESSTPWDASILGLQVVSTGPIAPGRLLSVSLQCTGHGSDHTERWLWRSQALPMTTG
jgi:hypothetical protein